MRRKKCSHTFSFDCMQKVQVTKRMEQQQKQKKKISFYSDDGKIIFVTMKRNAYSDDELKATQSTPSEWRKRFERMRKNARSNNIN